jgi:multimeric flavodoxin WrbA
MKVIGINGSQRESGNTYLMLRMVFDELEKSGIETEIVRIGGKNIRSCTACGACSRNKDGHCVIASDMLNETLDKVNSADGIVLGSPTYFADVTPDMKAFIDRAGMVENANGSPLKYKAGAALTAVRRGGAIHSLDTMNHWLHYMQTFMVGSTYWNMAYGRDIGDVKNDAEGVQTMRNLGVNMAYLLGLIARGR